MRKLIYLNVIQQVNGKFLRLLKVFMTFVLIFFNIYSYSQCHSNTGEISGTVFKDVNFNDIQDPNDETIGGIKVLVFDSHQQNKGEFTTGADGKYIFTGLSDSETYRVEFEYPDDFYLVSGYKNVVFVQAPECDVNLLLHRPVEYTYDNPDIVQSMFLQGKPAQYMTSSVLMSCSSNFISTAGFNKVASKAEVGSVWGMAFMKTTQQLFTAAFVKQYAYLGPGGLGAIYASQHTVDGWSTSVFVDLLSQGIDLGTLSTNDAQECEYGAQVGKVGLGAIALSEDERYLYAVNIYKNELVKIPTDKEKFNEIEEIPVPNPQCIGGKMHTFALKSYKGKLYVGVTCGAEISKKEKHSIVYVYEYDPINNVFGEIFSTNYSKGYLHDEPTFDVRPQHWITDIDFTDEGNMIIVLNDRTGHRYCRGASGRLDTQNGEILLVWNNNGTWELEDNGKAGIYTGTGVGNGEGPGGGEFFGDDFWPTNPSLHPETSTGSALIIEGTGEVIVPSYDPEKTAYSGGIRRYNTADGSLVTSVSVYTHKTFPQYGKASAFGDLDAIYDPLPLEIGDYVWFDMDKDGIQDPGEPGLEGIDLSLYDENCNKVGSTVTNSDGYYVFDKNNVDLDNDGNFESPDILKKYYVVIDDIGFANDKLTKSGKDYYLTILNRGYGTNRDNNDNDASIARNICSAFEGKPYIEVFTKSSGQNLYNADFGFAESKIFDLALRKVNMSNKTVHYGDMVTFKITVFNQGNVPAHDIVINDYLNSGFEVDPNENTEWTFPSGTGMAKYKYTSTLMPGGSFDVYIKMKVKPDVGLAELVNYAEISSALDPDNNPGNDIDSVMDDDSDNDIGGIPDYTGTNSVLVTDDLIDDDGAIDEDDEDPAIVKVLDLALQKVVLTQKDVFTKGDTVTFGFNIFNQGNVVASSYKIIDYLPEDMIFDPALNPGWTTNSNSVAIYEVNEELLPFTQKQINIKLIIKPDAKVDEILNYGEISEVKTQNEANPKDYDSVPNKSKNDDVGGIPGTSTDNQVNGSPMSNVPDEDDQDVAVIIITNFDLALTKKALNHNVKEGDDVEYEVEIFNQGSITADKITLVDYLDDGFVLDDSKWSYYSGDSSRAQITLSVANGLLPPVGLLPGKSVKVKINLYLEHVANGVDFLTNEVEIKSAYDIAGDNLGIYDNDSTPDDIKGNDAKGADNQLDGDGANDEDDHDWATVFVRSNIILDPCICLNNATKEGNGQFAVEISIISQPGETWVIDSIVRFYDWASLPPPNPPVEYALGTPVPEIPNTPQPGFSTYTIQGKQVDGVTYYVRFRNNLGDTKFIDMNSGVCSYDNILIDGATGTCMNNTEIYTIQNPAPNAIYTWSLSAIDPGGTFVGSNVGTSVTIHWGNTSKEYDVNVSASGMDVCMSPKTFKVKVGNSSGALALDDYVVSSVDTNCQLVVNPDVVIATPVDPATPFKVIIIDPDGNMLPDNIITSEYIGMDMMVKVVDQCSGQQGMSRVKAIDKQKPEFDCVDAIVDCDLMSTYPGPDVTDNCDTQPEVLIVDEQVDYQDCTSNFTKILTRKYLAIDKWGNVSDTCVQHISINRLNKTEVEFPDDFLIADNTALTCNTFATDDKGNPVPSVTGTPHYHGKDLYTVCNNDFCGTLVGYNDFVVTDNGCEKIIIRTWQVIENCEDITLNNIITHTQTIEIHDLIPPLPVAPHNLVVTTNGWNCSADVLLPALEITDNCSTEFKVDIVYPGGFKKNSNGGLIQLPVGEHHVFYNVYDQCDNLTKVDLTVKVIDKTAPVAICQSNTIVSLSSSGEADAPALSFDSGSYDDCGLASIEARRMFNDDLGATVHFDCNDLDSTDIMVVLRATDYEGNWNECMVTVNVQHKYPPQITCPDNMTVECDFPYEADSLAKYFGNASATDVCGVTLEEESAFRFTDCGTGYIRRHFIATGRGGLQRDCYQRIDFVNSHPFTLSDITWPTKEITTNVCGNDQLSPDELNEWPVLNEDQCDIVSMNYSDQTFFGVQDSACYTIVRSWTVLDECQKENGVFKTWHFDQLIHVVNTIDPFIEPVEDVDTCTFDSNCQSGYITLEAIGSDDCTAPDDLQWTYIIDLNNDGTFEDTVHQVGAKAIASGEYPIGTHRILWQVEDRCGNSYVRSQLFTIKNCKKPTAICKDKLVVELGPALENGDTIAIANILAKYFDGGSYHSCGYPLKYSFSLDVTDTILYLDCSWIRQEEHEITLFVTDTFGNVDQCKTHLTVQDNFYICNPFDRCITYPLDSVVVESCNPDLDPGHGILDSLTADASCGCDDYIINYSDTDVSDGSNTCQKINREWSVDFNCSDLDTTIYFTQIIVVKNHTTPDLTCAGNITVDASASCNSYVTIPVPVYTDGGCNTGLVLTNDSPYADSQGGDASGTYPEGTTTVTYTLTDDCGNTSQCSLNVTVQDITDPLCVPNDTTVALGVDGTVEIDGSFVASGSTDNCGISTINVNPDNFDCDDIGANTVNITVTDNSGNQSNCTAVVTIIDTLTELCNAQDATIYLDDNGVAVLDPADIYAGSGGCGGSGDVSLVAVPDTFYCSDIGQNTVQLIVTDNTTGVSDTCESIVTVEDTIAPECLVQNTTVYLDDNGNAAIEFSDIDNGSNDQCGVISSSQLSDSSFDCNDTGSSQTVIVTLSDPSGNTSSCEAQITVSDTISPVCQAVDTITVYLDSTGMAIITGNDVASASTDNCGIDNIAVNPDTFFCADVGFNSLDITVSDNSGNQSFCTSVAEVIDTITQLCMAHDTILYLDENGVGVLDPADIYAGGSGCGGSDDVSLVAEPDTFGCDDLGDNIVQLIVTDNLTGASDTCEAVVTVIDTIPPQCLVQNANVYLDDNGVATLTFEDIDNGSNDPCGMIIDTLLSEDTFDCTQTDTVQVVTVTLTDNSNNTSTCQADITVLDTIAPQCEAVDTLNLYLDETGMVVITGQNVDNGSNDQCGFISMEVAPDTFYCNDAGIPIEFTLTVTDNSGNSSQCTGIAIPLDTIPPTIECPADSTISCTEVPEQQYYVDEFGEPLIYDNCSQGGNYNETDVMSIDNCGAGFIARNFEVSDPSGNTSTCTQLITIESTDNFGEEDITWPADTVYVENCYSTDPDSINSFPILDTSDAECSDITTDYEDTNLTPGGSCNDTIQRVWTVVDSCQFDMDPNTGIYLDTQIIIVFDTLAPLIYGPSDTIITVTNDECQDIYVDLFGYVVDCDPNVVVTNDSPYSDDPNSADASGYYPGGSWLITINATDQCGNSSTYSYNLEIDFPIYCIKGTFEIGEGDSVLVYVDDVTANVPSCADMSFSPTDPALDSTAYYCADIDEDHPLIVYKFNQSGTLLDSCTTDVKIIDPNGFCDNPIISGLKGTILTENNEGVENVEVQLAGDGEIQKSTNVSGKFEFMHLEDSGNYLIKPLKNDDVLNGITTTDIIKIQKHLLGIANLDSPYKMIAADINNNKKISASDILQLRKLILGEIDTFANNSSWKFIDIDYDFLNKNNPFYEDYPQEIKIESLNKLIDVGFVGVKTGDVNNSAWANSRMPLQSRSSDPVILFSGNKYVEKGQEIVLPLSVENELNIEGMQFTLSFNSDYLEYTGFENAAIDMEANNIGTRYLKKGLLTVSWNRTSGLDISKDEELISFAFKVKKSGILSDLIEINSDITQVAIIDDNEKESNVKLEFRSLGSDEFILFQNEPNPWSFTTNFRFELPEKGDVKINITNGYGALLYKSIINGKAGINNFTIGKNEIRYSGLLFVDMEYQGKHRVKKMIKIN